jgi:hypothetical protein
MRAALLVFVLWAATTRRAQSLTEDTLPKITPRCTPDAHTLCLNQGRFAVTAGFQATPEGPSFRASAVPLTDQSGYFWFFDPANVELIVKVLNGCGTNSAYWVFGAGLTNIGVILTVRDLLTEVERIYTNPVGTSFAPNQDTSAFSTCP